MTAKQRAMLDATVGRTIDEVGVEAIGGDWERITFVFKDGNKIGFDVRRRDE